MPSFSAVAVNESDHIWKIVADDIYIMYAIFLPFNGDSVVLSVAVSAAASSAAYTGTAAATIVAASNAAIIFFFMDIPPFLDNLTKRFCFCEFILTHINNFVNLIMCRFVRFFVFQYILTIASTIF